MKMTFHGKAEVNEVALMAEGRKTISHKSALKVLLNIFLEFFYEDKNVVVDVVECFW